MKVIVNFFRSLGGSIGRRFNGVWRRYRSLRPRYQIIIGVALLILIIAGFAFARSGTPEATPNNVRTVTLERIGTLSGSGDGRDVLGTVRSITEAEILAQTGGTVRRVAANVNSSVGAGYVLAELENASERAAVLQAEGAYDSAVAARTVTVADVRTDIRTTYTSAFTDLDTTVESNIDQFFGGPTAQGPDLLITTDGNLTFKIQGTRTDITQLLTTWRKNLSASTIDNPDALLAEMQSTLNTVSSFLVDLARAANGRDSGATSAQLTALAQARATVDGLVSTVAALRNAYEAQKTASSSSAPTATEAQIKQALGSLRLAQANLEKTVIRAPIGGTVNFLPIRVGDYVTSFMHVATVAQNGALEIVAFVSEEERAALTVGQKVTVEGAEEGIITSIAPALDPTNKQIEIHVAVQGGATSTLVNGQSVRISIPKVQIQATPTTAGPILLPLASVKLRADDRIVFTVNEEGKLVANHVEIGEVRGDRIEVLSPLSPDLRIVTDARGLAEGETVQVASGL